MSFRERMASSGLDGTPGFMLKVPGTPHRTQLPSWDHPTVIRVFPQPGPNGTWFPSRNSDTFDDFSEAVTVEPVVRKLGVQEKFTYVTRIPGAGSEDPTTKFCKALIDTAKNSPHDLPRDWCEWVRSTKVKPAQVVKVNNNIFFQAAVFVAAGKPCTNRVTGEDEPQFPALFCGPISLALTFSRLGNTKNPDYTGPSPQVSSDNSTAPNRVQLDEIYGAMFKLGDWCSPEGGRLMKIFQAEIKETERPYYDIEMGDVVPLDEEMQGRIRQFWTPWKDLIRYHTAEEQIGYLVRAFPIEAVDFALGRSEYECLLPVHVRGSWDAMCNRQRAAFSPGMQHAASVQINANVAAPNRMPGVSSYGQPQQPQQPQQAPQQPPAQTAPAAPARKVRWGTGAGPTDEAPSAQDGPAVPSTPAQFNNQAAPAQAAPENQALSTPDAAVQGVAVDPAKLAAALTKLHEEQDNTTT